MEVTEEALAAMFAVLARTLTSGSGVCWRARKPERWDAAGSRRLLARRA
jgi:hypothetical protein